MAEIKIEKKKPIWPWILAILILLALVAYFVYANNENDDYSDDMNTEEVYDMNNDTIYNDNTYQDESAYPDPKSTLMDYSESITDSTRIGTDSTYTKTALYYLSKAAVTTASQYNLGSSVALDNLQQYASQKIGMNTPNKLESSGISKDFKTVSSNIVTVLQSLQIKNFPMLQKEVDNLKETSDKISTANIEKQKTTLQTFFNKANEVLSKMNS